ncbi:MAG: hypothetical protein IJF44_04190 [Clostridia bacterium]|nr:hypothetical protein [Clostridia bacterium]
MKVFKKLAGLCLALTLCSGICAFAACGESEPADDSTPHSSTPVAKEGYKFKIVDKDGNPVQGYKVQLCINTCTFSEATDANGEVTYGGDEGEGAYEIHVFTAHPNDGGVSVAFEGPTTTPTAYSENVIVLTLAE